MFLLQDLLSICSWSPTAHLLLIITCPVQSEDRDARQRSYTSLLIADHYQRQTTSELTDASVVVQYEPTVSFFSQVHELVNLMRRDTNKHVNKQLWFCVCVCVCVSAVCMSVWGVGEQGLCVSDVLWLRQQVHIKNKSLCVCVCVCVC